MAKCAPSPGCSRVLRYKNLFIILLVPLALLPLPVCVPGSVSQCGFVMLLMGIYWCTEAVALAVTSLIPIFIFPLMGILTTKEVCTHYLKDTTMMFAGGLMVALAVEKCNLHKRLAINILLRVGTRPAWLMLGFMLPTWFLSMWISNTATTAMMLPIMEAVLQSLEISHMEGEDSAGVSSESEEKPSRDATSNGVTYTNHAFKEGDDDVTLSNGDVTPSNGDVTLAHEAVQGGHGSVDNSLVFIGKQAIMEDYHPDMLVCKNVSMDIHRSPTTYEKETEAEGHRDAEGQQRKRLDAKFVKMAKGMTLAVAYAANSGGIATLTGTGPNPIMKDHADQIWQSHGYDESPVTFASWIVYGMPVAVINVVLIWIWLVLFFTGPRSFCKGKNPDEDERIKNIIRKEHEGLGKIKGSEVIVAGAFTSMVLLWFFRSPNFIEGWADQEAFKDGYVADAVVSIFIAFVLCVIPSQLPACSGDVQGPYDTLLDWKTIQAKFPWGIVFLMGGGFALADASQKSGLSDWIADLLTVFAPWPGWAMVAVICLIVCLLTEVTSNSATCTILMPIVSALAESIGRNPLYLMFPVAISTSFAFMLPVATPPNAIAFSYGRVQIIDMVKGGAILNVVCVATLVMATHTWADAFFNFDVIPWAVNANNTMTTLIP